MSEISVTPVSGRADLREFIMLPFRLYKGVDQWVPPLISERKHHLDRKRNPYFEHAEAEYFLARRDGRVVGRITAQVDENFNAVQDNEWGQFGFFESEDDPEIARALIDAAFAWLRERGRDHVIGPLDFSTNHECGLLVEGFELRPQILENWHHPYYAELIEGCGLTKAMDLYKWSLHVTGRTEVMPVLFELAEKLEPEHGITIRGMRRNDLNGEISRFMEIYNAAWERNWGFVPLTDAEIRELRQGAEADPGRELGDGRRDEGGRDGRRRADPARLQPGPQEAQRAAAAVRLAHRPARAQEDRHGPRLRARRQARVPAHRRRRRPLRPPLRHGRARRPRRAARPAGSSRRTSR